MLDRAQSMITFTHRRALKPWRLQPLRAAVSTPAPTGLLVSDTFTGSDNTVLSSHTPDLAPAGSAWSSSSFVKIISNTVMTNSGNYGSGLIDAKAYDVRIIFTCVNNAGGSAAQYESGILARVADGKNYRITFNVYAKLLRIWEYNGSTYIARASVSIPTLAAATLYTVTAVLQGASISAQLDGANDISYTLATTNLKVTTHGLFLFLSNFDYGDNFSIEGL